MAPPFDVISVGWRRLRAVEFVLQHADARVAALEHVADQVQALLDVSGRVSLTRAAATGYVSLFERVLVRQSRELDDIATSEVDRALMREYWLGQALVAAVKHGHLSLVQRIHALHPEPLRVHSLRRAASRGDLAMLEWLLANRHRDELCALSIPAAPSERFLDCCTAPLCRAAQSAGKLHVVRWLYEHALVRQLRNLGDRAAELGDLEMVQWIHAQRAPHAFSAHAMDGAAAGGFLDVVRFLHEHRTEGCTAQAINGALLGRHDDVVAFLRSIGAPEEPTLMFFIRASGSGRVDLLERETVFLSSRNTSWLNPALLAAARLGQLPVVQWLVLCRRMVCSPFALGPAAANGHLHLLQWVHAHDCGNWTLDVMDQAAERGQLAVVQWLHANRSEGCSFFAMDHAAAYGHLDVVRWLHHHRTEGCTTRAMDFAATGGHLDVVRFLHEHRHEGCTTGAMDGAAANGHLHVVQWLHEHRSEGATTEAMDRAAANGHLEMVRWLHLPSQRGLHRRSGDARLRGRRAVAVCAPSTALHEHRDRPRGRRRQRRDARVPAVDTAGGSRRRELPNAGVRV
ncbi:hypothetical protein PINS_up001115 [Pythium insidiosum]|nr:hypothetical protein PINS_up001115 [Pythium insidiosum]